MMASELGNVPAFPRDERYSGHNGMTLRQYYAGQALPGVMALCLQAAIAAKDPKQNSPAQVALGCLEIADALLTALQTPEEP